MKQQDQSLPESSQDLSSGKDEQVKKPYQAPGFFEYGNVIEITKDASSGSITDQSNMRGKGMNRTP